MSHRSRTPFLSGSRIWMACSAIGLTWLAGCSTPAPAPKPAEPRPQVATEPPRPAVVMPEIVVPEKPALNQSFARDPREYRKDAARHLYAQHPHRIFKGRLPPMLKAVGVIHVDIDQRGGVKAVHWQRAPRHVPQVMREIENMVKAAAPYPVPAHMSQVTYTDVWLWHKSGKFQLDTLTEGQD